MSVDIPNNSNEQPTPPSKKEFLGVVAEIVSTLHVDHSDPAHMTDEQLEAETTAVQKMGEMLQRVTSRVAYVLAVRNEFFEANQEALTDESREILDFLRILIDGEYEAEARG